MAAIRDVEVDAIKAGRKSLVALALTHQTSARVARKQAIKELFAELLASWEAGVPFDAMAKALTESGIQITSETLRGYFFELKTAEQLRSESAEHERAMAKIRRENEAQQRTKDLQRARELAKAGSELASSARDARAEEANQVAAQAVEAARRGAIGAPSVAGTRVQPARDSTGPHSAIQSSAAEAASIQAVEASPSAPNVGKTAARHAAIAQAPAGVEASAIAAIGGVEVGSGGDVASVSVVDQTAPPAAASDASQTGVAKTLDEIVRTSQGQKETAYGENLVLKEGNTVWYESGKPFDGYLSPRTLHTLRNVGRVIAPTEGRTAKDFVPMSHEL